MEYKDYIITEFVNDKGQSQARVRRKDGKHIRVQGTTVVEFSTHHADSEIEATRIAREAIDSKMLSLARD
jgi:hypothetical protein